MDPADCPDGTIIITDGLELKTSKGTEEAASTATSGEKKDRACCAGAKAAGARLKIELLVAYVCLKDRECGWGARFLVVLVLCLACSPMDWAPEFAAFLAATADILLMPLLIRGVLKLVPPQVIEKARCMVSAGKLRLTMRRDWLLLIGVCVFVVLNVSGLAQVSCMILGEATKESYICMNQAMVMAYVAVIVAVMCGLFAIWRLIAESRQPDEHDQAAARAQAEEAACRGMDEDPRCPPCSKNAGCVVKTDVELGDAKHLLRVPLVVSHDISAALPPKKTATDFLGRPAE